MSTIKDFCGAKFTSEQTTQLSNCEKACGSKPTDDAMYACVTGLNDDGNPSSGTSSAVAIPSTMSISDAFVASQEEATACKGLKKKNELAECEAEVKKNLLDNLPYPKPGANPYIGAKLVRDACVKANVSRTRGFCDSIVEEYKTRPQPDFIAVVNTVASSKNAEIDACKAGGKEAKECEENFVEKFNKICGAFGKDEKACHKVYVTQFGVSVKPDAFKTKEEFMKACQADGGEEKVCSDNWEKRVDAADYKTESAYIDACKSAGGTEESCKSNFKNRILPSHFIDKDNYIDACRDAGGTDKQCEAHWEKQSGWVRWLENRVSVSIGVGNLGGDLSAPHDLGEMVATTNPGPLFALSYAVFMSKYVDIDGTVKYIFIYTDNEKNVDGSLFKVDNIHDLEFLGKVSIHDSGRNFYFEVGAGYAFIFDDMKNIFPDFMSPDHDGDGVPQGARGSKGIDTGSATFDLNGCLSGKYIGARWLELCGGVNIKPWAREDHPSMMPNQDIRTEFPPVTGQTYLKFRF